MPEFESTDIPHADINTPDDTLIVGDLVNLTASMITHMLEESSKHMQKCFGINESTLFSNQ